GTVGGDAGLCGLRCGGGRGQQARQECQDQQQGGEARGVLHTGQLLLSKNISLYYATSALPCQFFTTHYGLYREIFVSFSPLLVTDAAAGAYFSRKGPFRSIFSSNERMCYRPAAHSIC